MHDESFARPRQRLGLLRWVRKRRGLGFLRGISKWQGLHHKSTRLKYECGQLRMMERFGAHLWLESLELPGRPEKLLLLRGFAGHVPFQESLDFVKNCYWGYDPTADDMRWLTQWQHVDWVRLDTLLQCDEFGKHTRSSVENGGFGQLRWYGAKTESAEHSDGFDGRCVGTGHEILGTTRYLLRFGGDGYLNLRWRRRGGQPGKCSVVLHHGDLAMMDRGISGTRPCGRAYEYGRLRVTHRAGGMAALHAPRIGVNKPPKSFCTLIWTSTMHRDDFLHFFRTQLLDSLLKKQAVDPVGVGVWPEDPDTLQTEICHHHLKPWRPGLTLYDRQVAKRIH